MERNHRVVVITAHSAKRYQVDTVDGMEVHFLPIPYDNRFGFVKRIVAFLRFTRASVRLAQQFADFDLCYAMSVPLTVGIAARKIQRRHGIPFIFEVGDLWPDAPLQMGVFKGIPISRWLYALERRIYHSAHRIVALSPAIQEAIGQKSGRRDVDLISNMADTDFYQPSSKNNTLEKKFGVENSFVVAYIGAVGEANGLEHFIACARSAFDAALPIRFILCGDGARLPHIRSMADRQSLPNFSIVPFQTRGGVRDLLNVTDAVFISYKPVPILETGSPNKYFDGLAAGKLVITNFGGWIAHEIETCRCGVRLNVDDPADFVTAISPFLHSPALLKEFQLNARALAERKYARRILSERFVGILSEVSS